MASNVNYPRKYYSVTMEKLSTIPIRAGNVISISDSDAIYYDIPKNLDNVQGEAVRRKSSGIEIWNDSSLPTTDILSDVIYVLQTGNMIGDKPEYKSYIWDKPSDTWYEIANNNENDEVNVTVADNAKIYFTGSITNTVDGTTQNEKLTKNSKVWLEPGGTGYILNSDISGNAASATFATEANHAQNAENAENANEAKHSEKADYATNAEKAIDAENAEKAIEANHSKEADHALSADSAASSSESSRAAEATHSEEATHADRATNDDNNQAITSYLHTVVQNDKLVTFYRGDGTTLPDIVIPDTTYEVYSNTTSGLVPSTDVTIADDSTNLLLTGDGWLAKSRMAVGSAEMTTYDSGNNPIVNTYIKDISIDNNILTMTRGDDTSTTIEVPMGTYDVYSGTVAGLVPPNGESESKYLSGVGTWEDVPIYSVATKDTSGLVPLPIQGESSTLVLGYRPNADAVEWLGVDSTVTSENSTSLLYLLGATAQTTDPTTSYSNVNVYMEDGDLYGKDGKYVTINSQDDLTNKTYNGYTLGDACAKEVSLAISGSSEITDKLPTVGAVNSFVASSISPISNRLNDKLDSLNIADPFGVPESFALGDYCIYNGVLYKCKRAGTSTYEFVEADWEATTVMAEIKALMN